MGKKKSEKRIKKEKYWKKLFGITDDYTKALLVDCDNVSSKQINMIRYKLREQNAVMIMGKNTLMKAALNHKMKAPEEEDFDYEDRKDNYKPCEELDKLVSLMRGNTGFIFSNGNLAEIKKVIDSETREAPAKVGIVAPDDVWIKAGPTGLDPKQTGFFQTLQITTKIVKTQIEIVSDKRIIAAGSKIDGSQCALLDKLKIRPFSYKMEIKRVYDNGALFPPTVLDITPEDIREKLKATCKNMAGISMGCGYITKPATPHLILNAFKNLAAVTFDADYTFKQAEKLKDASKNAVVVAAPAGGAPKVEEKVEVKEEKEEEADVDMGGLFGDDEY